ncbi:DUF4175 family protein [Desertivirga xinjiangensis]|uniref:DUF4175 family protein n=1 Tax=Desertivirga xinjiangensis TaxID=539206 RepID=UPI00210F198D|nr:DUF4175 family protein [Pedobacter xinjiangensis]
MKASASNYSYLIDKIDEFIRKYYLNQVVRGVLYLFASFFASYIIVAIAEFYGNFSQLTRTILFYSFLLLNGCIFINWIFIPILHYYRLGRTISHEQASEIIGRHFNPVKDKLLNTLQLKRLADESKFGRELIEASINQKIFELKPIPFTSAIKIKDNRKYLKYVLLPLVIIVLIGATAPSILSESTERLLKHDRKFEKKAPFDFLVLNKRLSAVQGDDFELRLKMIGNEIPQDIYLEDGLNTYKLNKETIINFNHVFRNIQGNKQIRFIADEYTSKPYTIYVQKKPSIIRYEALIEYPAYLNKKNEYVTNSGDLSLPAGTNVKWKLTAANTSQIEMKIAEKILSLQPLKDGSFRFSQRFMRNTTFYVSPFNEETRLSDPVLYHINIIPDLHPSILISERPDPVNHKTLYFFGQASDDHGFTALRFKYRTTGGTGTAKAFTKELPMDKKNNLSCNFFHTLDVSRIQISPGQQIEYYFEIYDNDGVNGPKVSRSPLKVYKFPTVDEMVQKVEQSSTQVQNKMQEAIKMTAEIERETKRLNQQLLNKRDLNFEEKKQIEQLLDKQKQLEQLVQEIQQENSKNLLDRKDLNRSDEKLLQKQREIEDLFNNVLDEKTKDILKKIEKLLDQNNKSQTQQELSNMQKDNKDLHKELDRILELYKQLEFDQKLDEAVKNLDKLAEKQNQLKEQTKQNKASFEELKKQQEDINKAFDKLKTDLKGLEEKAAALEKNNFELPGEEQKQIEDLLNKSEENLENKNSKRAAEKQQQAASEMKELSDKLDQMQDKSEQQENQINMQSLRQILDNLLNTSFDQENVMQTFRSTSSNDPNYIRLTQKQKSIKDNLKLVQDSLYALSKKVPQIESVVNKEIQDINQNIENALNNLAERRTAEANRNQQYAMTSINNLALMLSEVQEALQKMQNSQQKGKGKQKSLSQLSQMQEELNKNMQNARQQMQSGNQNKGQGKESQMSEQMARMAREQQLIRQSLQEINRDLNKNGKGELGNLDKVSKEMEQSETDLVNKTIRQETLIRQQEILTRLLEAEKSERERELDTKRESKQGKDQSAKNKIVLDEFKKLKQSEIELLKTVPPSLNSFYKMKVGDYFRILNTN